jgi:hypothetical protein
LRRRLAFSSTDLWCNEPLDTEKELAIKQMMSQLYRDLGKFGYHLVVKAFMNLYECHSSTGPVYVTNHLAFTKTGSRTGRPKPGQRLVLSFLQQMVVQI